jgi:hypothetical protein
MGGAARRGSQHAGLACMPVGQDPHQSQVLGDPLAAGAGHLVFPSRQLFCTCRYGKYEILHRLIQARTGYPVETVGLTWESPREV